MLLYLIYALYHKVACKRLISIEILLFDVLALLKYCCKQVRLTNVIWNDRTFHASVLLVEDPKTLSFFLDSHLYLNTTIMYHHYLKTVIQHTMYLSSSSANNFSYPLLFSLFSSYHATRGRNYPILFNFPRVVTTTLAVTQTSEVEMIITSIY